MKFTRFSFITFSDSVIYAIGLVPLYNHIVDDRIE